MKRFGIALALALGLVVVVLGTPFLLIESGEVIVLRTMRDLGDKFLARLWIVDHDGNPWIGKMDPSEAKWVRRLREHPTAQLVGGCPRHAQRTMMRSRIATNPRQVYGKRRVIAASVYPSVTSALVSPEYVLCFGR